MKKVFDFMVVFFLFVSSLFLSFYCSLFIHVPFPVFNPLSVFLFILFFLCNQTVMAVTRDQHVRYDAFIVEFVLV